MWWCLLRSWIINFHWFYIQYPIVLLIKSFTFTFKLVWLIYILLHFFKTIWSMTSVSFMISFSYSFHTQFCFLFVPFFRITLIRLHLPVSNWKHTAANGSINIIYIWWCNWWKRFIRNHWKLYDFDFFSMHHLIHQYCFKWIHNLVLLFVCTYICCS